MKMPKKSAKPYWEMTKQELADATREFDRNQFDDFEPLSEEQRARWERLRSDGTSENACDGASPVRLRSAADVKLLRERINQSVTVVPLSEKAVFSG